RGRGHRAHHQPERAARRPGRRPIQSAGHFLPPRAAPAGRAYDRGPTAAPGTPETARAAAGPAARRPSGLGAGRRTLVAMSPRSRRARVEDVRDLALGMPHVTVCHGTRGNPIYQVGGKSFVFFRNPRPDAVDPETGERYA